MKKYLFTVVLSIFSATTVVADTDYPYRDSNLPIDQRVEDLLSRMTLEEKVLQLQNRYAGADFDVIYGGNSVGTVHEMNMSAADCMDRFYDLQEYMTGQTRLGIPVITCAEGIEGIIQNGCTIYPHAIAQGSTWNPDLIRAMTASAAEEAEAIGVHQILSPVLDLARELRWGRVEETYGEDPFLTASIATAFIDGYQRKGITCTPKHFVAHGTPAGGLNCAGVTGGPRDLWSLYLYPFRRVIAATDPLSVMSCYSAYDGVPVTASHYYMTDVLRDSLGFRGYVYSDWGSVERLRDVHHAVDSYDEAARLALKAGVDLDIDAAYGTLPDQVEKGFVSMEDIDRAVRRVLRAKFELGLFDRKWNKPDDIGELIRTPDHVAMSRQVADESAVLLINNGILPLDLTSVKRIAVIGPNSDQTVMGDYSWTYGDQREGVTLLEGLREAVGNRAEIVHADGCDWWSRDTSGINEAVTLAQTADVIVAVVGTRSTYLARNPDKVTAGEGFDNHILELPGVQEELLESLKATGKPLVVVLVAGKPVAVPWVKDNADAFLVQWYAGERQGESAAHILLGDVNPSGRLNVSFPKSTGNIPCFYNYLITERESIYDGPGTPDNPGHRYIYESPEPLWWFGEGLSYTGFEYGEPIIADKVYSSGDTIQVTIPVTNTGNRDGKEVVQLYVRDLVSSVATPKQALKAFSKVNIPAGNTINVDMEIPVSELGLYNEAMRYVVEPGDFELQIGHSSNDIRYRKKISVR